MSLHIDDPIYSIHHRQEIISILENLKKARVPVRLHTRQKESFVTSILDVNPDRNHVHLDVVSIDEQMNSRVAGSEQIVFTAQTGIAVKWHSTNARVVKLSDGHAFAIPIPAVVQRVQRREYFRLQLPLGSKGMVCRIPVSEGGMLDVPVRDMSAGGVGVVLNSPLHPVISMGAILEGCILEFPDVGIVSFKLRICNIRKANATRSGTEVFLVGLEFTDMGRGASNVVQRYMIHLESELGVQRQI